MTLNKPIYGGLAILDFSKIIMSRFFYEYLKPKFGDRYQLLMTDTDSFMGQVYSHDFYKEIEKDIPEWFDTSNYPKDHFFPKMNKKKPGYFEDEMGGVPITRFVGLYAKQYAYESYSGEIELKCKGITKQAMKNITFEDYIESLGEKLFYTTMNVIKSRDHTNYTETIYKKALDGKDEKRIILDNGFGTVPYGYY